MLYHYEKKMQVKDDLLNETLTATRWFEVYYTDEGVTTWICDTDTAEKAEAITKAMNHYINKKFLDAHAPGRHAHKPDGWWLRE